MPRRTDPLELLDATVRLLVGFLFLILILTVFAQVIFRYVFSLPLIWAEDLSMFSFIWLAFLGSSLGVRHKTHFVFDMVLLALPPMGQRILVFIVSLLILTFSFSMLREGWIFTAVSRGMLSYSTGLPMVWMYAAVPVGGALCTIFSLENVALSLWGWRLVDESEREVR